MEKALKGNKLNKRRFDYTLLISPLITVGILLVIYYLKGIYPFGTGTTVDFDCTYKIVPEYFYLHDAWHSGSIFYDFTTAGGFARDLTLSLLRPGNIFMLLFPRDQIVNAMNYLLLFRMAIVSFTAVISFKRLFPKLSKPWVITVALMYTFCGYNLEYFTYIEWLEAVAVFPLISMFAVEMFRGKGRLGFFLSLTYLIYIDTYFSYFVIVGLIIFAGLYIFIVEEKEKRKKDIFNLGVGTVGAMLAGAYQLYYFLVTTFNTARFGMNPIQLSGQATDSAVESASMISNASVASSNASGFIGILKQGFYIYNVSFFMLLGTELAVVSLILMWLRFKKHKSIRKHTFFFTVSFSLLVLQLFLRSCDLLWHGGSYACFPVRNGFILGFLSCAIVAYYFSNLDSMDGFSVKSDVLKVLIPGFCAFSFVLIVPQLLVLKSQIGVDYNVFAKGVITSEVFIRPFFVCFAAVVLGFLLFKIIKQNFVRSALTIALVAIYVCVTAFSLIGDAEGLEKSDALRNIYTDCSNAESLATDSNPLSRTNNTDLSLLTNYPYAARMYAVSNWTATLTGEQLEAFNYLGFSTGFTLAHDAGGTQFSKALLRTTHSVSKAEQDERLYRFIASAGNMNYYENRFTLPLGMVFDGSVRDVSYDDYINTFEYQNEIYSALGYEGKLFDKLVPDWVNISTYNKDKKVLDSVVGEIDVTATKIKSTVSGKSIIYLVRDEESSVKIDSLYVNGKQKLVESGVGILTTFSGFPQNMNNNVLELGVFESGEIELQFDFSEGSVDGISLYALDLDKLQKLCDSYEDNPYEAGSDWVKFSTESDKDDGVIFLPIAYDREWKCTVNGEEVEPVCVLGDFIGLPAVHGANEVQMHYSHRAGYIHIAASVVLPLIALGVLALIKRKQTQIPGAVHTFAKFVFTVIFGAAVIVLYAVPLIFAFINLAE